MSIARLIFALLGLAYLYGAGVHVANMLSATGFDWGEAPLRWQVLDVVYLVLDLAVAALLLRGRPLGAVLLSVAAVSQILLYTVGRAWILDVPPAFAPSEKSVAYLDGLVAFHVVSLVLVAIAVRLRRGADFGPLDAEPIDAPLLDAPLVAMRLFDFSDVARDFGLVSISPGHDGALYGLFASRRPPRAGEEQAYRVVEVRRGAPVRDVRIASRRPLEFAQPLPHGELLLVTSYALRRDGGGLESNASVFREDGGHVRELVLGDGVQHVQTSPSGFVWVGYYDEGILGTEDPTEPTEPIGRSGLTCWDARGNLLHEFVRPEGLGPFMDCYALNVADDSTTWLSYHVGFPIVGLTDRRNAVVWRDGAGPASSLAIAPGRAVVQDAFEDEAVFRAVAYGDDGRATGAVSFLVELDGDGPASDIRSVGRGPILTLIDGPRCYELDARDVPLPADR